MNVVTITADWIIRIAPLNNTREPVVLCWRKNNPDKLMRFGIVAPAESYTIGQETAQLAPPVFPLHHTAIYPEYVVVLRPIHNRIDRPGSIIVRHPDAHPNDSGRPLRGGANIVLEFNPAHYAICAGFMNNIPGGTIRNSIAAPRPTIGQTFNPFGIPCPRGGRKGGAR